MRVLLTNLTLASRTGTEIVTRDLARGLAAAGHTPVVFTPDPGGIAQEIRESGIPVTRDLTDVTEVPDVIHGHHYVETTAAILRFPQTPAIFVCHDRFSWHDLPPHCEQIRRYVAVDRNCLERLTVEGGLSSQQIRLIHNAVDITRFSAPRRLPEKPRRALIFSNYAARGTHMEPVIDACGMLGVPVDVIGSGVNASSDRPESLLHAYDIVFAKARCALEAMAAGAAVVLCDTSGLGPMVTLPDVPLLRDWNFGMRCLQQRLTAGAIAAEIMKYNAADAQAVSAWVRATATLDTAIRTYIELYEEVIGEARSKPVQVRLEELLRDAAETSTKLHSRLRSGASVPTVPLPHACIRQLRLRPVQEIRSVEAGTTVRIPAEIENASNETLASRDPHPVHLAYHWIDPVSGEAIVQEGHRTPLTREVPPGNVHRQTQIIEVPDRAGRYLLRLTLVQELVCWFEAIHPAIATDVLVEIRGAQEPAPGMVVRLRSALRWTEGLSLVRDGEFSDAGFASHRFARMLTFIESARFARQLTAAPHAACVLTTPELAPRMPDHVGIAVCDHPRACFVDIHNYLAEQTHFYWRDFPTIVDPAARIHPSAQIPPFNVIVGAGSVIEANAVVGERVLIGEHCIVQSGAVIGAEGFQTDRSGGYFREMVHAGGVRLETGCKVFAGAVIARGVFREFTHIGAQARVGNGAFVSHNVGIGTRAFVGHGAVVNGNVNIGDSAWIGPGAIVANNLTIGPDVHVGLGSAVIRDLERNARVIGAVAVKSDRMLRFTAGLEKE